MGLWNGHRDGRSLAGNAANIDVHVVLLCKSTNHEQAEETGRRLVEFWRVLDTLVEYGEVLGVDTEALILDLKLDRGVSLECREQNNGRRIGELRGVVEKLCEHVGDVGNNRSAHVELRQVADFDSFEELNLSQR